MRRWLLVGLVLAAGTAGVATQAATPLSQDEAARQSALELLINLVGFRTAKGHGEVPAMIDVIVARLKQAGFTDDDIVRTPLDIDGEKASGFVVRFKGKNPSRKPVLFLAHMDVVDAVASNWATDPFTAVERDGYLYGRGVQDNKFGVALLTETFARLKRSGWRPERDLVLAFSGDEESGMRTTRENIKLDWVKNAEFALNSDAGGATMDASGRGVSFAMQAAEKTYADFEISTANAGGHSSAPRPDNAIFELATALKKLEALQFPVQLNEITRMMLAKAAASEEAPVAAAIGKLLADPTDAEATAVMRRVASPGNLLWTTCVPTMMRAGNAPNALPQNAVVTVNCRIMPGTPVDEVRDTIAGAIGDPKIKVSQIGQSVSSPASPVRRDVLDALTRAVNVNYPGMKLEPAMSAGGTEGREYRTAGIPTYGAGSLALVRPADSRAHGTDERIPLVSFYKELDFWNTLVRDVGGSAR